MQPVLKPDGQYRLTTDYRNLSKFSPKMNGDLLDAEEVLNGITARNSKYIVTIGMSDMLVIPIALNSRDYTTFSWESTKYQFKRLPQGYLISPVIAHTLLASHIDITKFNSLIILYIDDIIMMHDDLELLKEKRQAN